MLLHVTNIILAGTLTGIYFRKKGVKGFILYLSYLAIVMLSLAMLVNGS